MKNMLKKCLSLFLAITIIFSSAYVGLGEIDFGEFGFSEINLNIFKGFALKSKAASVSDLTFTKNSDGVSYSVKATATTISGDLVIPATYEGLPVTGLSAKAFYNCTKLTSVIIPESVTSIGLSAFQKCTSLTSIKIPDSVTSLGNALFNGCTGLVTVELGIGITSLPNACMTGCTNLVKVNIPENVKTIGTGCFKDCKMLEEIYWDAKNVTNLTSSSNIFYNAGISGNGAALIFGETVEKIPAYLCYVASSTYTPNISALTIPENVTSIGEKAFYNCNKIKKFDIGNDYSLSLFSFANNSYVETVILGDGVTNIEDGRFYNCSNLKSVTIGKGVRSVGSEAFYSCEDLESVTMVNGITSIGNYAFNECTNLISVTIPDSVTSIGDYAFAECESITSINIPDGITSIGNYVFYYCKSFRTVYWNATDIINVGSDIFASSGDSDYGFEIIFGDSVEKIPVNLVEGVSNLVSVTIGKNVKSIGYHAFFNCSSLTDIKVVSGSAFFVSVDGVLFNKSQTELMQYPKGKEVTDYKIPDSVIKIGEYAFYDCDGLTTVDIPDNVTSIEKYAFYDCDGLTTVEIPDNVTSIGSYAFYGCYRLTTVNIADSVTSIGDGAFEYCEKLESITLSDNLTQIGGSVFYQTKYYNDTSNWINDVLYIDNILIRAKTSLSGRYSIKSGTKFISSYAFKYCESLTSVTIPNSVTSIGDYAFEYCESLASVTIGKGVTKIGYNAFSGCYEISSWNIADVGSWCSLNFNRPHNKDVKIYLNGVLIENLVIPEGVTDIVGASFYNCSSIKSVTFPESLTDIGFSAFYGCSNIEAVYITDLKSWCSIDFSNYSSNPLTLGAKLYINNELVDDVVIPQGTKTISTGAFYNCDSLTSIIIPDSVTKIEQVAFYDCDSLASITIPDGVTTIDSEAFAYCDNLAIIKLGEALSSIASRTFCNCINLTSITIPNSVTSVGYEAFKFCKNLIDVKIGDGLTDIEKGTFSNCDKLSSVEIGVRVKNIGASAFAYCKKLISITIPEGVTNIGNGAFYNCDTLTSITLPDSVITIEEGAMDYCDNLTEINVREDNANYSSVDGVLFNKAKNELLKYPEGKYAEIYRIPDGVTTISASAFSSSNSLISIIIPEGVTSIGDRAFKYCKKLTSVTIPNSITEIGEAVFEYCEKLTSVTIPDSVTEIGDYAFYGCTSLSSITLPDSLTSISDSTFYECDGLTSIVIPESVTSIGAFAFRGCDSLASVLIPNNVTTIGEYAFCYNLSLTTLIVPESVVNIGEGAFYGCDSLVSIALPDTITDMGEEAFYNCPNLKEIFFSGTIGAWQDIVEEGKDVVNSTAEVYYYCVREESEIFLTDCVSGTKIVCSCPDPSGSMTQIIATEEHKFVNGRCSKCNIKKTALIQSEHPYGNFEDSIYTIEKRGANNISVLFSHDTVLEKDKDYIKIYDADNALIGTYTGAQLQNEKISVTGDTVRIRLVTDEGVKRSGFRVADIIAEFDDCPHPEKIRENIIPSTCIEHGTTGEVYCVCCDELVSACQSTPLSDHPYGDWVVDRLATYNTSGERHKVCTYCGDVVTDNEVDYARFDATFIRNGGKCDESSRTLISEEPLGELPTATKPNYIFRGWTLSNGGTDYVTEEDYITDDTNLYASWELVVPQAAAVSSLPVKTGYCVGDEVETRGLKLMVTYNDESTKIVSSGFETEYDFSEPGEATVEVTYTERSTSVTTSYDVYVNAPARLYSENVTADAGETVDVPVYIENNPGLVGFTIYMEYDDTVFTPVCVNGDEISGYGMLDDNIGYTDENKVQVSWSGTENYYDDGELFNITFEVSGDSDVRGDYDFNITYRQTDTFDENINDVVLECENTTVTVVNEQKIPSEIGGNKVDVFSGRVVEIPVEVKNNSVTAGTVFTLDFDSEILTYVGVADGIATTEAESTEDGTATVNVETIAQTAQGTIFTVKFNVKRYYSGTVKLGITSSDSENITKSVTINVTNPDGDMPAVVYSDAITGELGDIVLVPVYIENNKGMYGFKIRVTFDSDLLKPVTYCKGEPILSDCGTMNNNISSNVKKGKNYYDVMFYGDELFKENGKMFTLKFTLKDAIPGYTSVKLSYSQADTYTEVNGVETDVVLDCKNIGIKTTGCFVNSNKVYLSDLQNSSTIDLLDWLPVGTNASIKNMVTKNGDGYGTGSTFDYIASGIKTAYTIIVKGDADGDSAIDVLDAMYVERASNNLEDFTSAQTDATDFNGDGEITAEDYSAMVNLALH